MMKLLINKLTIIAALTLLWVCFTSAALSSSPSQGKKCLTDLKENPKRFFQNEDKQYNITLSTSKKIGNQLMTNIFAIFLREVLDYKDVTIITHPYYNATYSIKSLTRTSHISPPTATVNLGFWVSPNEDTFFYENAFNPDEINEIENCGYLGVQGKYGWFIPKSPSLKSHKNLDYWRSFQDPKIASLFALDPDTIDWINNTNLSKNRNGSYYCNESNCKDGFYESPLCRNNQHHRHKKGKENNPCGVLLASYPESSRFLKDQIEELELRLNILWVGPNLRFLVRSLVSKYKGEEEESDEADEKAVLFFDWKPTLLTSEFDLITVSFPACNNKFEKGSFCVYESRKLEKIVWSKLKTGAYPAYEAIHRFQLSQTEYSELLEFYLNSTKGLSQTQIEDKNDENDADVEDKNGSPELLEDLACKWMKSHKNQYDNWKPHVQSEKPKLYIGGIFPMRDSTQTENLSKYKYKDNNIGIAIASRLAVEAINKDNSILKNFDLELWSRNGMCRSDMVLQSFIEYIRLPQFSSMAGILGPSCSDTVEPLAGVAKHFGTVVISYSAEGSSFSDREKYPYFFRTIPENKLYQYVYKKLFQNLNWKNIATFSEEGQKYAEYLSHLHDLLSVNGINIIFNRKFPRDQPSMNMSQYLQDLKRKQAKIIIGDFYETSARRIMCEAYKQKMTAKEGYVWFLPAWFTPYFYDTDHYNNISKNDPVPCNTKEMIDAFNGHFQLQYSYWAPSTSVMQENITVDEWRDKYANACQMYGANPSDYGGFAYDAVWVYAHALERLYKQTTYQISNLHTNETTLTLVKLINETNFLGVSGQIKFKEGPSRLAIIHVVQWVNKTKYIVGSYQPDSVNHSNEPLQLNISAIRWFTPDGNIPNDGSIPPDTCVLESLATALDVSCEIAIVIANIFGLTIFVGVLVVCFIFVKRRYDQKVQMTEDYLKNLGIDILSANNLSALDKWETPRDRIVINRKLGEGAFGTVYGGELFLDEKGWIAVAVKTLKVGSTCEQKLDFLGEAEVMKRFEHKNIIKLLGVCTKNEPIYTVMEFMLYGDLKTYLLARRHLVNERGCEESDEISSKRLTLMALDIARGLSYLAELKYVHRDVACRNCLVNASRVIKIGDFGMTRPIYENDYYRFNRKGMLPVRWMAPESLALGIFTPQSDCYSFGVLLYEVITFGSFPFQGKSNNEVLELVKSGLTLPIPKGVRPQLEQLLTACWTSDPGRRPQSSEIVEFLANNPRIITPSLDIPLMSCTNFDADQHNLTKILERPTKKSHNKGSSSSRAKNLRNVSDKEFSSSQGENIPLTPSENSCSIAITNQFGNHNHHSPYTSLLLQEKSSNNLEYNLNHV